MYMDDFNLFAKNEKEFETLIQAVRIYIQGIGMEFVIEKCALLIMKIGKWPMTEEIKLPNQEKSESAEKKNYMYLVILTADTIKQVEMKEKKN